MSDKIFYTNSMKMLFTLLWILSLPKMLCYELEGINQCNWVCKCRIKAEFKLFSAQHFFENSILFIFSNKQLFLFTTFHVHQFSSGWFLPFSQFTVLADQSDQAPRARLLRHSPGSAWHWGGHTRPLPGHLVLRPPQPGPGLQIPVRGPRQYREDTRTDLTSARAITGRARWTGLKIPWRLHFIGPGSWCSERGHHWDDGAHESCSC